MEIVKLWEILWRRKWIFLATLAIITATAIIVGLLSQPTYEAQTKVLVSSSDSLSSLMSALGLQRFGQRSMPQTTTLAQEEPFATEITFLTLRPVAVKLIEELELTTSSGDPVDPDRLTDPSLLSKIFPVVPTPSISVEQLGDAEILGVTARSSDPELTARMANRMAELAIDNIVENTKKDFSDARIFIQDQIRHVQDDYSTLLNEKKDFMLEQQAFDLTAETRNLIQYISQLKNQHEQNDIALAEDEQTILLVEQKIGGRSYVSSNLTDKLEAALADLLTEESGQSIDFKQEHPDIQEIDRKVALIRDMLEQKADLVLSEQRISVAPIYQGLVTDLKNAYIRKRTGEAKRQLLQKNIDLYQGQLMAVPIKTVRQSELDLAVNTHQTVYQNLLQYLMQVGVAESMTISNIRILEPAATPDANRPVFPNPAALAIIGIIVGSFWGGVLVFLAEQLDNTLKTPEDIETAGLSVLGTIPVSSGATLLADVDPNDPLYEAYRGIAAGISFARLDHPPTRIVVTSVDPRAGSSTVTVNLGTVYASEKRVLLVDMDLRRPGLHRLLNLSNDFGLTDVLSGDMAGETVVQETRVAGLSLISSGPAPPDPGLLLKSQRLGALLSELNDRFDVILCDSAPLLIKNDAILLMNNLDGLILVARNGATTHRGLAKVCALLRATKTEPIGAVFNCFSYVSGRMRRKSRLRAERR